MPEILKHKKFKWLLILIGLLLVSLFSLNLIIEKAVKDYIDNELSFISQKGYYSLAISDVDVEIFEGDVKVLGFVAEPTESSKTQFQEGTYHKDILGLLKVNSLELEGLDVFDILFKDELTINTIFLDKIDFKVSKSNSLQNLQTSASKDLPGFSFDSIRLPGLKKINLNRLEVGNYSLTNLDFNTKDTLASVRGKQFTITGLRLQILDANKGYFKLDHKDLEFSLNDQQFKLEDGLYDASFEGLNYNVDNNEILLTNILYEPVSGNTEFSSRFKYSYLKHTLKIDTLYVYDIDLESLLQSAVLDIGFIDIKSMAVSLTRDMTKPYDKTAIEPLPLEMLQNLKQPVYIDKLQFENTTFKYNEILPDKTKTISVQIDDANGKIEHITSIPNKLYAKENLRVSVNGRLLNTLTTTLEVEIPYRSPDKSFFISGSTTGISDFEKLNPVAYPATGILFKNGSLDGMSFEITCNEDKAKGELIMLYSDLEVEISKKDKTKQNTKTWLANTLAKKNNPNKSGKVLAAEINFKRVKYKDILDYVFKSVRTGIINIIIPGGKKYVKE